jgi:hypothetical protein
VVHFRKVKVQRWATGLETRGCASIGVRLVHLPRRENEERVGARPAANRCAPVRCEVRLLRSPQLERFGVEVSGVGLISELPLQQLHVEQCNGLGRRLGDDGAVSTRGMRRPDSHCAATLLENPSRSLKGIDLVGREPTEPDAAETCPTLERTYLQYRAVLELTTDDGTLAGSFESKAWVSAAPDHVGLVFSVDATPSAFSGSLGIRVDASRAHVGNQGGQVALGATVWASRLFTTVSYLDGAEPIQSQGGIFWHSDFRDLNGAALCGWLDVPGQQRLPSASTISTTYEADCAKATRRAALAPSYGLTLRGGPPDSTPRAAGLRSSKNAEACTPRNAPVGRSFAAGTTIWSICACLSLASRKVPAPSGQASNSEYLATRAAPRAGFIAGSASETLARCERARGPRS